MSVLNKIYLPEVILHYNGGRWNGSDRFVCPFCLGISNSRPHAEPDMTCKITSGKAGYPTYGCFRCHEYGNALKLIEYREGLTGEEPKVLVQKAIELGFLTDDNRVRNRNLNINPSDQRERIETVREIYNNSLENKDNRNIVSMLQRRKISQPVIQSLYGRIGYDTEDESIVFPIVSPSGGICAIHKIKANPDEEFPHGNNKFNLGKTGDGFFYAGRPMDEIFPNIILVEGIIDALTVASVCPQYAVLSAIGTQHKKVKRLLERKHRNLLVVAFDNDENQSGIDATNRLAKDINKVKRVDYDYFNVITEDNEEKKFKDLNEIMMDEAVPEADKEKIIRNILSNPKVVYGITVRLQENGVIYRNQQENLVISPFNLAKFITNNKFILSHDSSEVYIYNGKCYDTITEKHLDSIVSKELQLPNYQQLFKGSIRSEFRNFLTDKTYINNMEEKENENRRYLTLDNCLYDLEEHCTLDHTHGIFTTGLLPYEYDGNMINWKRDMPNFYKWITSTFDVKREGNVVQNLDMMMYIQEIMGYVLYKGMPRPSLFILLGQPGCGKNVLLDTICELVGFNNMCSVRPESFNKEQHVAELHNKLVNICGDIDKKSIEKNVGIIKDITDNGVVSAKLVYQPVFKFTPYCKHFFACNDFPAFIDNTHALYDRIFVIPFLKRFRGTEGEVVDYIELIKPEMSAIFNWAIVGLKRLIDNNFTFNVPQVAEDNKESFKMSTDHVYNFIKTCLVEDLAGYINKRELRNVYNFYAKSEFNDSEKSAMDFKDELKAKGIFEGRTSQDRVFKGIRFSDEGLQQKEWMENGI